MQPVAATCCPAPGSTPPSSIWLRSSPMLAGAVLATAAWRGLRLRAFSYAVIIALMPSVLLQEARPTLQRPGGRPRADRSAWRGLLRLVRSLIFQHALDSLRPLRSTPTCRSSPRHQGVGAVVWWLGGAGRAGTTSSSWFRRHVPSGRTLLLAVAGFGHDHLRPVTHFR
jgi:hypothetical protein